MKNTVPAINFLGTLMANLDNEKLSDSEFRQFIRNTLPIVEKPDIEKIANEEIKQKIKKYYKE
jgi:hypothetical protein